MALLGAPPFSPIEVDWIRRYVLDIVNNPDAFGEPPGDIVVSMIEEDRKSTLDGRTLPHYVVRAEQDDRSATIVIPKPLVLAFPEVMQAYTVLLCDLVRKVTP